MTDNEKRAHDLTILYMQEQMKHNYYSVVTTEHYGHKENVDYVSSYIDLYLNILERLEQNLM